MSEDGDRWVRVSRGLYLVGFGTFLLLTSQGMLPRTFWIDAAAYWPVLLVAIGLRLLFERGRAPWLVLLGPLLVLGTMLHVALRPAGAGHEGDWTAVRLERPADASGWTMEGRLAIASLDVESRRLPRNVLAEGRTTEAGRHSVRVEQTAGGRVRVTNSEAKHVLIVLPGGRRARCELGVAAALPLTLDLDLAFTATRLDLPATPVSRLAIDGAFNDLSLRLGAPAADVHLDFDGAFNQMEIEVPAGTPVRTESGGFLNLVDQEKDGDGSDRRSGMGRADAPAYRLNLDGAFNRVVVRAR